LTLEREGLSRERGEILARAHKRGGPVIPESKTIKRY